MISMLNKWDYSKSSSVCYSDYKEESYKKSAKFLGDSVEDWGCGTGWSKRYFKEYRGIDGSQHPNVDEIVDLAYYTSNVDNILIRQVLEFNWEWRKILENVKKSFKKKFCLVVMTPLVDETRVESVTPVIDSNGDGLEENNTPDIFFNKQDILDFFPEDEFIIKEELIDVPKEDWPQEWMLCVERK